MNTAEVKKRDFVLVVGSAPTDVRQVKVERLRALVRSDAYRPSSLEIAGAILEGDEKVTAAARQGDRKQGAGRRAGRGSRDGKSL